MTSKFHNLEYPRHLNKPFLVVLTLWACLFSGLALADTSLARDSTLKIVRIDQDKSADSIAREYLQDKLEAWQIIELNGRASFKAGDIIALPLVPINPVAVYAHHYRSIPVLCYHRFSPRASAKHQMEVSAIAFDKQMAYLVDNGYQVIPFKKMAEILSGKTSIPPKAVVLTIDDGYRSVYDIAFPILKKYGLNATLFVYTDFIGGSAALSWQQIKDMKKSGFLDIESHTKTHSSLSYDTDKENIDSHKRRITGEIKKAEAAIHKHLGQAPSLLAYPYGDASPTTIDYLKTSSDYALAATVKRGANSAFADPLLIQRTMVYNSHSLSDFKKMLSHQQPK
ncbi:MAG: polysaccharide deacetylase family protein [Porticoccaceae bacterium]|nr:polysaccharide deacetylase family protein [Porticoccaceae bacterium]